MDGVSAMASHFTEFMTLGGCHNVPNTGEKHERVHTSSVHKIV
jgi:hypothetical protein